jgi:hypothetical protein
MTDVVNNVATNFIINNKGAAALSSLTASAGRVSSLFDRASNIVGTFGSVAAIAGGAMSLTHVIKGTQTHLEQLKKVQDYTKMSAQSAGGMVDAMESVGITTPEAVRALMMMSKAGARADMAAHGMRRGMGGMGKEYKRLGIDMSKGPEAALMRMATLVQKGKVDQAKVGVLFRMQGETARKLTNMLAKGPEAIREQMKEYAKLGIATQENIDRQERIRLLGLKIGSTWENIQRIIGVQLLPVVEDLMSRLSDSLEEWLPKAQAFGKNLADWLTTHYDTVKNITKVLLINFALVKLTSKGMIGWGEKLTGGFLKAVMGGGGGAAATAATASAGAGSMARMLGERAKVAGAAKAVGGVGAAWGGTSALGKFDMSVRRADRFFTNLPTTIGKAPAAGIAQAGAFFTTLPKKVGPAFKSMGSALPGMLRFAVTAIKLVGAAAVLALIIATIFKAVQMIRANVSGLGDYVYEVFDRLYSRILVISDLFSTTFGQGSPLGDFFQNFVGGVVLAFVDVLDAQVHMLQTLVAAVQFIVKYPMEALKEGLPSVMKRAWDYTGQLTREKSEQRAIAKLARMEEDRQKKIRDSTKEREQAPYNDFRNSRFDIQQRFSEGFDPDRIALAFSSDLAALGERKLQSGFSPMYAVR